MLKIILVIIATLIVMIIITAISDKIKVFRTLKDKIKDFFDVMKYKRQRNTAVNKYNSRNDDYVKLLEDYHELSVRDMEKDKQIIKLKDEKKELKRIIMEDMVPKKKRSKKGEKN